MKLKFIFLIKIMFVLLQSTLVFSVDQESYFGKFLKILKEGMVRDKQRWSQETFQALIPLTGKYLNNVSREEFRPLFLILAMYRQFGPITLENKFNQILELNHPLINLNDGNDKGETLLHYLAQFGYSSIKFLGKYPQVNFELMNDQGKTTLDLVAGTMRDYQEDFDYYLLAPCGNFRCLIKSGVFLDLMNPAILNGIRHSFKGCPKHIEGLAKGEIDQAKSFINALPANKALISLQEADWKMALSIAIGQGHVDIVNLLLSNDVWITHGNVPKLIAQKLKKLEILIKRFTLMLEQKDLSTRDQQRYQERLESYNIIRLRLRAALMLPLESLRQFEQPEVGNKYRACAIFSNEILFLIGAFLFGSELYKALFTKVKF
ncbi:MAG TPA: hypothetical protein VHA52_13000 [Candidatus Babeliaceae bacterium]|nr:hypothetical protein [Candidatus Babeliaceae bacterium]